MVSGTRANAEALHQQVQQVLAPIGLRLLAVKTRIVHLDEGLDFLGWHIQRRRQRGSSKRFVYTYPSKKALAAIKAKVRALTNRSNPMTLKVLLQRVNAVVRGWCAYFKHGVVKHLLSKLDSFVWRRVAAWLRKRHHGLSWAALRKRFMRRWDITIGGVVLLMPSRTAVTHYRYRGQRIPTPWAQLLSTS